MKEQHSKINIPPEGIETPLGYLFNPPGLGKQIISLVLSFFVAIFLGWVVGSIPGDLSDFARGIIIFSYLFVFILGYAAWIVWLNIIVFGSIKLPILKIIFGFLVRKEKPKSVYDLLPAREKVIEIMVRAQKATRIFFLLSWPIGIVGGIAVMFLKTSASTLLLSITVAVSAVAYGYALSYFGRRGYLPFPEE